MEKSTKINKQITAIEESKFEYINKFQCWIEAFTIYMQDIENEHELLQKRCLELWNSKSKSLNQIIYDYIIFKEKAEKALKEFEDFDDYIRNTIQSMEKGCIQASNSKKTATKFGAAAVILGGASILFLPALPVFAGVALASGASVFLSLIHI